MRGKILNNIHLLFYGICLLWVIIPWVFPNTRMTFASMNGIFFSCLVIGTFLNIRRARKEGKPMTRKEKIVAVVCFAGGIIMAIMILINVGVIG